MNSLIAQVKSFGLLTYMENGVITWLNLLAPNVATGEVTVNNLPDIQSVEITVVSARITATIVLSETFPV